MTKVLGLDISSSVIGWSVLEYNEDTLNMIDCGYFKPKGKFFTKKAAHAYLEVKSLISEFEPDEVAVEDYAKRFSKKKSSAHTLMVLAAINEVVCLAIYMEMGVEAHKYAVATIRSSIGKFFKYNIVSKDDILPFIAVYWERRGKGFVSLNRIGRIRKECGDVSDSIAVSMTHILKNRDVKHGEKNNLPSGSSRKNSKRS